MAARINEISFTKNSKSEIFIKNPNLTKNYGGWEGSGWGVARVSDFLKNPSLKKKSFFWRG